MSATRMLRTPNWQPRRTSLDAVLATQRHHLPDVVVGEQHHPAALADPVDPQLAFRVQGGFAASTAARRWVVGLYAQGALDPAPLVTPTASVSSRSTRRCRP